MEKHKLAQLIYQKRQAATVGEGRDARAQSLHEAAREIGISTSSLSRIERGSTPNARALVKICQWLGVSVEVAMQTEAISA